jgi:malonate-semialdehyde dehydrogenase (acetylating)/methylmalonate-semialdehyde dehydrogenase
VNLGIVAAMAHFPFAGQKDPFFGTVQGQGKDTMPFFTDSKFVITRRSADHDGKGERRGFT